MTKIAWRRLSVLLLSLLERLLPRLASSVTVIFLATVVEPSELGVYSWGVLLITAYAAIADVPARQIMILALGHGSDNNFFRKYRLAAIFLGGPFMLAAVVLLYLFLSSDQRDQALLLVPIGLLPFATAAGLPATARLQAAGRWGDIVRAQVWASVWSLLVGLALVLLTDSIVGAVVQALLAQGLLSGICVLQARRTGQPAQEAQESTPKPSSLRRPEADYFAIARYSGLTWLQAQADRVALGILAGPALLGSYALATALSRGLGDALAAGSANVLRTQLGSTASSESTGTASRTVGSALGLAAGTVALTVAVVHWLVGPLLGPAWDEPLVAVPLLAQATLFSVVNWSLSVLHVNEGSAQRAAAVPVVGILFSVPIAVVATQSLPLAALTVVAREAALALALILALKGQKPWRVLGLAGLLTTGGLVLALLLGA